MPFAADGVPAKSQPGARLVILALVVAGFWLTLYVFYPGVMTYDARYVYQDIAKGTFGDWQSPVMAWLWSAIDPIAPGPASVFLLTAAVYWGAFGLAALALARLSIWPAALLLLLAASPPAFEFVGIIWRDVLFAAAWLFAAALALLTRRSSYGWRVSLQAVGVGMVAFGVLLRPNALPAAPLLAAYIIWPEQFLLKRTAILYLPLAVTLFVLVEFIYYGVLHATQQHVEQAIMVFDLGGISHFANQNLFPGEWSGLETAKITGTCYKPTEWDIYWIQEPCRFVMERLESAKLFGTSAISSAWLHAIADHPLAYLEHRAAFMWSFLARSNQTIWTMDVYDPSRPALAGHAGFTALRTIDAALKSTPLLRPGVWLLICAIVCALAWRRRQAWYGAFAVGVCGSAAVYVLSFFVVGVALDFRYAYWAILAAISGAVVAAAGTLMKVTPAPVMRQPS